MWQYSSLSLCQCVIFGALIVPKSVVCRVSQQDILSYFPKMLVIAPLNDVACHKVGGLNKKF